MTNPARYEIEILAPTAGGRANLDTYTTAVNYAVDHTGDRISIKLDDGRDEKGRPVITASYSSGMRVVIRPIGATDV